MKMIFFPPMLTANSAMNRGFLKADGICTTSALLAAQAPLDPIWWRAISTAVNFGCTMNIVEIALLCSSQVSIFLRPAGYRQVADLARTAFMDSLSDHVTLSNAFNAYMRVREIHQQEDGPDFSLDEWCLEHALNIQALEDVRNARLGLLTFLNEVNRRAGRIRYPTTRAPVTDMTSVRKTLAIAFCTHTAIHHSGDTYRTVHENTPALLAPLSSLVDANHEWVVYTDFLTTGGKQFLQTISAINAEWLTVRTSSNSLFFLFEQVANSISGATLLRNGQTCQEMGWILKTAKRRALPQRRESQNRSSQRTSQRELVDSV
ncbi:hypothetical protein HDV64DRAFT_244362 [Trichoderma sp. TUCIM 5745]